ncbi:MAG: carboxy-S-adenosyl-L-methionine synthase CmoA [Desulfobulbaceae bacterium]|nr:carboxy-S-adenosyl-L-methionine synthase CmoA [Desulfobulbaceae bacterium]HIJ78144.1 carboxy-S-adenosyl-L-methionine synthase CmoA [Deltaproteobacteria bacterium]
MAKDEIFKSEKSIAEDFRFTAQVAEVFDDMLARSVPNYQQVISMSAQILSKFLKPGDTVYDLGCSTGATLLELARQLGELDLKFCGIDNSPAMISKAVLKAEIYSKKEQVRFMEQDITEADISGAGAIILNYTLQFIRPMLRLEFLKKVHRALKPGGVLILSEKIISHDPQLNRAFIDFYYKFKREQGYSEIEISKKREALENVLIPFSSAENRKLLKEAGFSSIEPFFQWFNFSSFVAVK